MKHTLEIVVHFSVTKAQYADTQGFEKARPHFITSLTLVGIMLIAIDFNHQPM